jgi:GTP pyrophosphokinase
VGVHVEGLDDVMVHLSRCCTPVPDDEIMGFVTRGRGVSVHRADCANAVSLTTGQGDRLIEVEWDEARGGTFVVAIELMALDRRALLSEVSSALAEEHVNILSCESRSGPDRVTRMRFDFELGDPSHLNAVLRSLKRIDSVFEVYRVMPGKGN